MAGGWKSMCNSLASISLLAPTWARTRNPLHTSTTATLEASLPIAPQKPRLAFLAKMDSRVVALESVLLVDGGETIVVQGLRVAPSVCGQGITGVIQRHVRVCLQLLSTGHLPENCAENTTHHLKNCLDIVCWPKRAFVLCCEVGDIGSFLEELQQRLNQKYKAGAFNPVTLSHAVQC